MTRSAALRIAALLVVLAGSFAYIAFGVAGWRLGRQDYRLSVLMPRGGGIYTEAYVTYRGVTVGRVVRIGLTPTHIDVVVEIRPRVRIPADSTVSVKELDAAGEQYLDFVPRSSGGPYLHPGSVVPASMTTQPVPIAKVLSDTSRLLGSINSADLNTFVNSIGTGLDGTDQQLRAIVVDGQRLFGALQASTASTVELVTGGNTVLKAAYASDKAFGQFATGIDQVSAQLKSSQQDINALLANAASLSRQTTAFLGTSSAPLTSLLVNLGTTSAVTLAEQPQLRDLLAVLPLFSQRIASIVHGGSLHVDLEFNTNDPVCSYVANPPPPTQPIAAPVLDRTCPNPGLIPRGAG